MYKLFLTFRYLTRKKIVIFPVLVVWLCVMMLVIVTSIMGGFVDRVRETNRALYGDIIISSGTSTYGWSGYDELAAALKAKFPQIKATTPTVEVYGLLYVPPPYGQTRGIVVVGVRPDERSEVSTFRESLFREYLSPLHAVEDLTPRLPATRDELVAFARANKDKALARVESAVEAYNKAQGIEKVDPAMEALRTAGSRPAAPPKPRPNWWWMLGFVVVVPLVGIQMWRARRRRGAWPYIMAGILAVACTAVIGLGTVWPLIFPHELVVSEDAAKQASLDADRAEETLNYIANPGLPAGPYKTAKELADVLVPAKPNFDVPLLPAADANFKTGDLIKILKDGYGLKSATGEDFVTAPQVEAVLKGLTKEQLAEIADKLNVSSDGVVVGSQVGFFRRDIRGNFLRPIDPTFQQVVLTVFPPSRTGSISASQETARSHRFTMIDDLHTGVYDTDATNVVAPLEMVQEMANMRPSAEDAKDPALNYKPRCHELLIKLNYAATADAMQSLRGQIGEFLKAYQMEHGGDFTNSPLDVQTWDEKQKRYLDAVSNEKVMITFILMLMSVVVLVVIFLIFYQIVRDKTRDIGIIKAVGGSEEGVAGIFLAYGLFIGVAGGGLGALSGWLFVTHTNEIHEWIFRTTGIIIWDRSVYLFDRIPDQVHFADVAFYFMVALVAGVIGALIPAIVAGAEDPVQAVRYE